MTQQNLPAYITQRQTAGPTLARRGLQIVGAGSPPYLSIEGGRFTLIDAGQNAIPFQTPYVDCVVVDLNDHQSKVWFGDAYDPNNPMPPRCFSDNGKAPSSLAPEPQSPTCSQCAFNKWGSKISQFGSEVKECADHQKIALIIPGFPGGCFLLRIPGGSFKNWRAYLARFERAPFDVYDVMTRIMFDTSERKTGVLAFESTGYLDPALAQEVAGVVGTGKTDMLVGRTDTPILTALPGPPAQGQVTYQPSGAPNWNTPQNDRFVGKDPNLAAPYGQVQPQTTQPQFQQPNGQFQQPQQQPQQPTGKRRRGRPAAAQQAGPGAQAPFQQAPQGQQQPFQGGGTYQPQQPVQQPFQPAQPQFQQQPFQGQPAPQGYSQLPGIQGQGGGQGAPFGFANPGAPPNEMMDAINQTFGQPQR